MNANTNQAAGDVAPASLYVGDLAPEVNEALLFDIFNAVGPVASIRVCRDALTGRSLRYAYVNFHNAQDADRAHDSLNFSLIANHPCRIMFSQRDPSLRKSGLGNVFVKNLASVIDNKTLYDTFSMFGKVLSCKVNQDRQGGSLGYGFVHYETEEAATRAIESVNGMMLADQQVVVEHFKARKERTAADQGSFTNVYVKNLPTGADFAQADLEGMFSPFGVITSSHLAVDADGVSKGFGFVNYEDADQAAAAIEALNGTRVTPVEDGADEATAPPALYVCKALKKQQREKMLREKSEQVRDAREKEYAGCNLYVKNLPDSVDTERLTEEFKEFGEIESAKVMVDPATQTSRGFGFVCFKDPEDAARAIEAMNSKILDKKPLYVAHFQSRDSRRANMEAHYAQRRKMGAMPPVFPGPPQMYFPGQVASGNYMAQQPQQQQRYAGPPRGAYPVQQQQQQGGGRGKQGARPAAPARQTNPNAAVIPHTALTLQELAAANPEEQRQMIGERLYPRILELQPERSGKITGMLLEMDNSDLLELLESPETLKEKVQEACMVLDQHSAN